MSVVAFAQNSKNDVEDKSLKGKVKSLREISYYIINKISSVEKKSIIDGKNVLMLFNKEGYFTETTSYNIDNSIKHKNIYTYNNKKRHTETKRVDEKGILLTKYIPIYNEKGQKIEYYHYNPKGEVTQKSTFSYDEKGNLINKTTFDAKGEKLHEDNLKYNNNNLFIGNSFISFAYNEKQNNEYIYDDNNRKIKSSSSFYDIDNNLVSKVDFDYNENEDVIKLRILDEKERPMTSLKFEYIYDKYNNWTKRTIMNSFTSTETTEREITYYE